MFFCRSSIGISITNGVALPLSYGSAPVSGESALKAPTGGRLWPQGPLSRKHAAGPGMTQNEQKMTWAARSGRDRVPCRRHRRPQGSRTPESWLRIALLRDLATVPWVRETHYDPATMAPAGHTCPDQQCSQRARMTDDRAKHDGKTVAGVKDSRRDRLKLALRENLKRRKSQARGRDERASSEGAGASLDDPGAEEPGQ